MPVTIRSNGRVVVCGLSGRAGAVKRRRLVPATPDHLRKVETRQAFALVGGPGSGVWSRLWSRGGGSTGSARSKRRSQGVRGTPTVLLPRSSGDQNSAVDSRPAPTDGDHRSKGPLVALIIAAVVFGLGLVMCWPDDPEPAAPNGRGFELTDEVPTAAQPAGPGMGPKAPPRCFRASSWKKVLQ